VAISVEAVRIVVCCAALVVLAFAIAVIVLRFRISRLFGGGASGAAYAHIADQPVRADSRLQIGIRRFLFFVGVFGILFSAAIVLVGFTAT
jgi:hypothetical protein